MILLLLELLTYQLQGGGITKSFNINQKASSPTMFSIVDVDAQGQGQFSYRFGPGLVPIGEQLNVSYKCASYTDNFVFTITFDSTIDSIQASNSSVLQCNWNNRTRTLDITNLDSVEDMVTVGLFNGSTLMGTLVFNLQAYY